MSFVRWGEKEGLLLKRAALTPAAKLYWRKWKPQATVKPGVRTHI